MSTVTRPPTWFVSFALLCLWRAGTLGDDWPQLRGPNRDGTCEESQILESPPPEGLQVRWRIPVARGFSSPIVSRGRVFVSDAEILDPGVRESVHCLEEATGKELWSYSADVEYPAWIYMPEQRRGPGSTPIVQDNRLYAMGGFGHLTCHDAGGGAVLWEKNLQEGYGVGDTPMDASPLIENDLLIVFIGGKPGAAVVAFDKNSGREVWRAIDEPVTHSSPIVIQCGGARQLIVWTQHSIVSLNPHNGQICWREPMQTSADYAVSTPVFHGNLLLISGLMFELDTTRPAATTVWPQSRAVARRTLSNTSTPLIHEGYVYSAKSAGELACLESTSGKLVWETDRVTDLRSAASIHITRNGNRAFLFNDRGELIWARLVPEGYTEIGRTRLIEPTSEFMGRNVVWVAPAFANRQVLVRNDKELICASMAKD